jgi:hypothetical protein
VKWPRLTAAAYRDLAEATVYFASKSRDAGTAFVEDFERALEQINNRLANSVVSKRTIPTAIFAASSFGDSRILSSMKYVLRRPEILAVVHGSQEPDAWKSRRQGP